MQEQTTQTPPASFRNGLAWLGFIVKSLAVTVEVFLHRRFGERYIGLQGLAGIGLILLFCTFFPTDDVRPLVGFLGLYLVMCFVARTGVLWRRLRRDDEHSRYTGRPRLLAVFCNCKELTIKRFWEPALVALGGRVIVSMNAPLGYYLVIAAIALFISVNFSEAYDHARVLDLNDSLIEQRQAAERFRAMHGDSPWMN